MDDDTERRMELKRQFSNFLDQDHGFGEYPDKIKALLTKENVQKSKLRLEVDVYHLEQFDKRLFNSLLSDPSECIQPFEEALDELIRNAYPKTLQEGQTVRVGFTGEFGPNRVSPRQLKSSQMSALVNVEGIVTKCSHVRPKIVKSTHYCETTGQFTTKYYRDASSVEGMPTGSVFPTKDEEGNLLTTEYGLCTYRDHQVVTIQELPETAPHGQLPRSAEITLEDDLVDACKPGDRVSLVGIYKALPPRAQGAISGTFRAVLLANSVRQLSRDTGASKITIQDIKNIEKLAEEPDMLDQLANSLAPSIYGHKDIKKGLLLQLLGGRERNLANGTHLRGDINCLLVGDPGVAKSQMLRAIMKVAPLAVSTTGKGSSGVGLTAAVTQDKDTGERRLEAGAMVLADRGLVCIDEFDKMNDLDRVAIHEVMEQQTVTIAKAGIQMSLNARCSVLAAANPLYGSYDQSISITKNINLPDSLLSRFDLLFIVTDNLKAEQDRAIASHVLGQHRYRAVGEDGRSVISDAQARLAEEDEDEDDAHGQEGGDMYVKYNSALHGPLAPGAKTPLSINFLRKFMTIVKRRGSELSLENEAMEAIADFYSELRSASSHDKALPVTVRTLETIIRLSTAAAKARLAPGVEVEDVEVATNLMRDMMKSHRQGSEAEPMEEDTEGIAASAGAPPSGGAPPPGGAPPSGGAPQPDQSPARPSRATRRNLPVKRTRGYSPEDSERSNDENDPGTGNRAGPGRRGSDPPLPDVPGPSVVLSEIQLGAIKAVAREMLGARNWSGSASVAALQARMSMAGHKLSEGSLIRALQIMTREHDEDPEALPIFYNADDAKFYEL